MSTFFDENRHFIRLKIIGELKHLSYQERFVKYNQHLKPETRHRLAAYHRNILTLQQRIDFYSEILDYLKDFEFPLILYSIYFEESAGEIIRALGQKIVNCRPPNFVDHFGLIKFIGESSQGAILLEDYIFEQFSEHLNLRISKQVSLALADYNNPEVNKISRWLSIKLQKDGSRELVQKMLLYFTKYWYEYHSKNSNKAIILLDKIEKAINAEGLDKMKVNLRDVILILSEVTNDIISAPVVVPFLDSEDHIKNRNISVVKGYLSKVRDFNGFLNKYDLYFSNTAKLSLTDLFKAHCAQRIKVYGKEVENRVRTGVLPSQKDLEYFSDPDIYGLAKEDDWSLSLFLYIVRTNYIFYYDVH